MINLILALCLSLFASPAWAAAIVDDNFTGTDGNALTGRTPTTGNAWTLITENSSNVWKIATNTVEADSGASVYVLEAANGTYASGNYSVSATVSTFTNPGTAGAVLWLGCRYQNVGGIDGYYAWIEMAAGTNDVRIYRVDNGTATQISGSEDTNPTSNDVFKLVCNGTSISLQKNGSDVIAPITDATYSQTGVAVLGSGELFSLTAARTIGPGINVTQFTVDPIVSARRPQAPMVLQ